MENLGDHEHMSRPGRHSRNELSQNHLNLQILSRGSMTTCVLMTELRVQMCTNVRA